MREIKYKCWLKDAEQFAEIRHIHFYKGETVVKVYDQPVEEEIWFDLKEVELMQYTGLKDADGKEVYEGDYIRFTDCDSNQGYEGEVAFKGGAFCMLHKIEGAMRNIIMATMLDVDGYIEIIGNIYENKNLLEEN